MWEVFEPAPGCGAQTQLVEGIWPKTVSHLLCEGQQQRRAGGMTGHVGSLFSPVIAQVRYFS